MLDVQDAIAEIEEVSGFTVPSGLVPEGKVARLAPYYFTNGVPNVDIPVDELLGLIINDSEFFFGLPARGFRGFGVLEFANSGYAPSVHVLEEGLKLSLCVPTKSSSSMNVEMPEAQRFFNALSSLVEKGDDAWQVEACENFDSGLYKFIKPGNFGLEFAESLVKNPAPSQRLNQMLAELAISSVSEISDVTVCQDTVVLDAWLAEHPDGLFIPYWVSNDFVPQFHINGCNSADLSQIDPGLMGWCGSQSASALEDWMLKHFGKRPTVCGTCLSNSY
jgi:hypothetical protein